MSFSRKLARKQPKNLAQTLGKIEQQAAGLNKILGTIPQHGTKQLLDSLLANYQTLADELDVMRYILRRAASLTPEQEQGYRTDYQKLKARG